MRPRVVLSRARRFFRVLWLKLRKFFAPQPPPPRPRLPDGRFLINKGFLKRDQLEQAKKVAQQAGETDIGKVLVRLNMIGEREILQAKAQEMGYAFADLDRVVINPQAIASVPEEVCLEHSVIPVKRDGSNL